MSVPQNSTPHRKSHQRRREAGNAFFIVLVAVVLFAALMFTFSRGARQGGDNLTQKQAEIAASELITTAQAYQRAVSRLQLRGCSEGQISFDQSNGVIMRQPGTAIDMSNPDSPPDFSCHVFNKNGGSLSPRLLPADQVADNDQVCAGCSHAQSPYITGTRIVDLGRNSGSQGTELVLWLGRVTRQICIEINEQLGITNPGGEPPLDPWDCNSDPEFKGSFENCANPVGDTVPALAEEESFCVDFANNGWTYIFMTVLITR